MVVIDIDADLHNADWLRWLHWPFRATSVAELREELAGLGITVAALKKLPVYLGAMERNNPPWLKDL